MQIVDRYRVPTGDILVVEGQKGKLECLSLGDYGKDVNIKCNALGLDRTPEKVRHTKLLPLTEKWVITISTQYKCSCECNFCDVPKVKYTGNGINATYTDLIGQFVIAKNLHREITSAKRINIHYARMGEPTFNPEVLDAAKTIKDLYHRDNFPIHQVVSTMMPAKNKYLRQFIWSWVLFKNEIMNGEAGLQLSINSTNEEERQQMFCGNALDLYSIYNIMKGLKPAGRKFTLNFAVAGWEIDPEILLPRFPPEDYIIKLTPMHKTASALASGIKTGGDYTDYYPYEEIEKKLVSAGYDVLVFIASKEEDESRITCGNAILSGTKPFEF
jgi:23S rRNA (adenine2503-C2)-methyltransferase